MMKEVNLNDHCKPNNTDIYIKIFNINVDINEKNK